MGVATSSLNPQKTTTLVKQESLLPSFSLDAAKFSDGSSGFVITTVDLAKNTSIRTISIKFMYSPSENSYVFVGNDETVVSFVRDRMGGKIVCSVSQVKDTIIRFCVTNYEPIDDSFVDKIGDLYKVQRPSE
jgi:hypothetical protein